MTSRCAGCYRRHESGGFVTVFTAGMLVPMTMLFGLVIDSGRVFRHHSDAFGAASAAARAGAQQLDEAHATQFGEARIDPDAAYDAAVDYLEHRDTDVTLTGVDHPGGDGTQIRVTVSGSTDLHIFPGGSVDFSVSATARAHQGPAD